MALKPLQVVTRAGEIASTLCVGAMAVFYTAEVIGRYVFASPLNWSGDVSSYLLVVCVFLMLPQVTLAGAHVTVGFLEDRMAPGSRRRYIKFVWRCCGVFCLITAAFVGWECARQFTEHVLTTQATDIPKWWLSAVAAIGLFLAACQFLLARNAGTSTESEPIPSEKQS